MRRTLMAAVVAAAIATMPAASALGQAPAQPQMPMGPGQPMGGGPGGPGGRHAAPSERPLISLMLQLRQQLGLSDEQVGKLTALRSGFEKEAIRAEAEIRVAEVEVRELLDLDKVDLGKVEAAIRKEESVRTGLRLSRIKALEAGKAVLNAEQREKFKKALEAGPGMGPGMMGPGMMGPGMMGPGMMGPGQPMGGGPMGQGMMGPGGQGQGMMGPGGQGQGMMMGPQMMQQMMGGGMGQQAAAGPSASPTGEAKWRRTDGTGPVTVQATLLDPGKAMDRIRVEVVLDTHSVDLAGYQLESLTTLRTDTGKSVRPLAIESASGGGHHRKGVLVFPAKDASGSLLAGAETLDLVVQDLGGVKERTLRWALP